MRSSCAASTSLIRPAARASAGVRHRKVSLARRQGEQGRQGQEAQGGIASVAQTLAKCSTCFGARCWLTRAPQTLASQRRVRVLVRCFSARHVAGIACTELPHVRVLPSVKPVCMMSHVEALPAYKVRGAGRSGRDGLLTTNTSRMHLPIQSPLEELSREGAGSPPR